MNLSGNLTLVLSLYRFTIIPDCDPKDLSFEPELSTLFYPKPFRVIAKKRGS